MTTKNILKELKQELSPLLYTRLELSLLPLYEITIHKISNSLLHFSQFFIILIIIIIKFIN